MICESNQRSAILTRLSAPSDSMSGYSVVADSAGNAA